MKKDRAEPIDVEVVSPGGRNAGEVRKQTPDPIFALIAKVMDSLFAVPGTKIRFGLDPILGLIPGFGDSSSAVISALLIYRGSQAGIPRIILMRMALNVLLNSLVGAIPVLGDLFSVWFKSNKLNYALYEKHLVPGRPANRGDWIFVCGLLVVLLLVVGLIIFLSLKVLEAVWRFIFG